MANLTNVRETMTNLIINELQNTGMIEERYDAVIELIDKYDIQVFILFTVKEIANDVSKKLKRG